MLRRILLILVVSLTAAGLKAQTDRQYVRNGNKYFMKGDFKRADLEYRKALSLNKNNTQALYNRGCANMQENPDSALQFFMEAGKNEPSKIRKAMAYHNIGWMFHSNQKYDEAIEAYKEALRNNPDDDETRYNLQLAMWQRKKNQEQNGDGQNQNQNQDNQNNQDQNKDNQDQNKDNQDQNKDNQDQNKDNQDQNKDNQDQNKDQDSKEQPAQQQQISDDNAERLLDAATQQEKRTQDRINKALQQPRRRNLQKNW